MKIRSRTELTIERHEIRTVRTNGKYRPVYCRICNDQTVILTADQLATLLQVSVPEICRQIDASEIHLASSERGIGMICGRSLDDKETHKTAGE